MATGRGLRWNDSYIKKNVCLFFMHLVPVIASIIKLSMTYTLAQWKTEMGLTQLSGGALGEVSPSFDRP